jgi:hypothetical protein
MYGGDGSYRGWHIPCFQERGLTTPRLRLAAAQQVRRSHGLAGRHVLKFRGSKNAKWDALHYRYHYTLLLHLLQQSVLRGCDTSGGDRDDVMWHTVLPGTRVDNPTPTTSNSAASARALTSLKFCTACIAPHNRWKMIEQQKRGISVHVPQKK